jgi:signal peptidase I
MTPTSSDPPRPAVVNVAFYVLLVLGILSVIAIPWNPGGLIQGPINFIAAWGIRRQRAWGAYGLALLTLVATIVPLAVIQFGQQNSLLASALAIAVVISAAIVLLLFLAGRALERLHGRRGMAWPWIAASAFIVVFFALFRVFQMPTGSMEETLLVGDHIAVWRTRTMPSRGEILVHIYPINRKDTFVKRVVGLPGDRVRIVNKQLFVNGTAMKEPYVVHKTEYLDSYRDNFPSDPNVALYPPATAMLQNNVVNGEVVVPPGHYFVLGDNRDSSLDSRYWGFIEQSDIIGTPKFVYYSTAGAALGQDRAIPTIRWSRFFKTVS